MGSSIWNLPCLTARSISARVTIAFSKSGSLYFASEGRGRSLDTTKNILSSMPLPLPASFGQYVLKFRSVVHHSQPNMYVPAGNEKLSLLFLTLFANRALPYHDSKSEANALFSIPAFAI